MSGQKERPAVSAAGLSTPLGSECYQPSIPDDAVEAAKRAYEETLSALKMSEGGWDNTTSQRRRAFSSALEAAAPHLMAAAWDEGMASMYESTSHEWPPIPERNPYRKPRHAV